VTCGRHEADVEGALFMSADVRKPADAEKVVAKAVEHFGRLDVLVNNAGGAPHAMAADMSPRFVEAVINLNLLAPLWCAQSAHKVMAVQEDGGCIVNVSSVSGLRPSPGASAYGAAKAGLINLTTTLAVEWAPLVRINCVSAGLLDTGAGDEFYGGPGGMERVAATVPLGRMGTPADVAEACLWLASPGSSYVSGANLVLHGGGEWPAFLRAAGDAGPSA
jgi:NAD(P)-dependent dehydrogenase (short-subunit alcohol dehydrogenase family)